ncbi:MAG: hypothetical protein ACW99F_13450 [Candidatus Hodarchaeales archaeon]|jgi:hypothetical protein
MTEQEKKFTQMYIDKDTKREIEIAAVLQSCSEVDIIRDAFKDYKIKQRIEDRIEEFKR